MVKKGMKSYLAYLLDDLAFEGLLEEWQDNYSKEYAEEQRIDYLTEMEAAE